MPSSAQKQLLPYVAVIALLVAALLMEDRSQPVMASPEEVERSLRHELESRVGAVLAWDLGRRGALERLADDPELRRELTARLEGVGSGQPSDDLGALLSSLCADLGGCAVARPDGTVVAEHRQRTVRRDLVERAARGRTVRSQLVPRGAPRGGTVRPEDAHYAVYFATPIVDSEQVRFVLVGRVHPGEELGPILGRQPPGRTGETYAIDPRGYMVTRSRFDAQRHRAENEVRLLRGLAAWRAMRPGGSDELALHGRSGADVHGYLDYRGVRVVGAWRWIDELGAGVVTEMDATEAFRGVTLR